jgi:mannose-1-phosphate guanylyltransferase
MELNKNTFVAILAGGIGSRFWPASREDRPKQFLDITNCGKSLLQLTFDRFKHICPENQIYIVTNEQYVSLVQEQLPQVHADQIIGEPGRNNTAPCVAYTAFKIHAQNEQANLIVAPSDHLIMQEFAFIKTIEEALSFSASNDALVTMGIQPVRPDTGYGYIQKIQTPVEGNVYKVLRFAEKPPLNTAKEYVESGDYLWNAGIFIWRTSILLKAFKNYAPEIYSILHAGADLYNTSAEDAFIKEEYPKTPSISVDYAIMEKADNVFTLPGDWGWSDLGTWASLYAESPKNSQGNVNADKNVLLYNTTGCLIRIPENKKLVVKDLKDFMIIDEGDILLIHPLNKEQEIKSIAEDVKNL